MVIALAITIFSASVANAQEQNIRTTVNFSQMSDTELQALFMRFPWMVGVYQASKGQDIDLTTISLEDEVTSPNGEKKMETKVWWELRNYTGVRFSIEAGGSGDFVLNDTTGTARSKVGGSISAGIGYVARRGGCDFYLGLSGIGTTRVFGYYNLTLQPYITPFRSHDELRRFDIGAIVGVQQAPATAYASFSEENIWGGGGRTTTNPRAEVGAFIKYQHRFFKTGSALGIKLSGEVFSASTSFEEYFENVTTGEVLIDQSIKVKDLHAQVKLTLTYDFVVGGRKSNITKAK